MNDIYSFYQLISKYQIEIPIIQRDYAQGRDNAKAADVRKSLVAKMIKAVKENQPLFFDFVYGRVDDSKFIPFDGQQRLTTLFLFHKYVFEKCQSESDCQHKCNCICNTILCRFTYATRQSSREFCEKLVQEKVIPTNAIKISDNIINRPWFYPYWKKDPTVMSMLTMLDETHSQMKAIGDFKRIAEKLTSGCNCPITFHFVDMGEHKLSDETYVKMNARGKQLTPFENFKASLEQYLEEKKRQDMLSRLKGSFDESKQKHTGIDGDWLDLFWNVVNESKTEKVLPDTLMMSFFNRHFMNIWRCWYANNSETKEYEDFNVRIQKDMPLYPTKDDFVSFEIYSFVMGKCGVDNCLEPIFNICDALCIKDNCIGNSCQAVWNRDEEKEKKWNLYQGYNNNNRETYPSRVAFYALMMYFKESKDTISLAQWMRIAWNIIENSTIDSRETYHSALRLINELSEHSHEIYQYLSNSDTNIKTKHAEDQVKEEIAKAKQILMNIKDTNEGFAEEDIIDAEKHDLLKGCISVLFESDNCEKVSFSQSIPERVNLLDELWNENDLEDYRLVKVLISLYDKDVPEGRLPLMKNKENWKRLVTDKLKVCFRKNEKNEINDNCESWKSMIAKTNLIENSRNDGKIVGSYGGKTILWATGGCTWNAYENVILDNTHNNVLLKTLIKKKMITCNQEIQNCDFFWGWNINFKYNSYDFQWNTDDHVYLIENNERKKKADGTDYCVSVEGIKDSKVFLQKLNNLINQV